MSRGAGDRPLTYVGPYDSDRTYLPREVVDFEGGAFMATAKTVGHPPRDRTYWMPLGREREALFSSATTPVVAEASPPYGILGDSTMLRFRVYLSPAGTSATTVKLYRNGTDEIASVTIASGATSGSSPYAVALTDGDVLTVAATAVGTGITKVTAHADLAA